MKGASPLTIKYMQSIINDLIEADKLIKAQSNYSCGLENKETAKEIKDDKASFFFNSPDGQNGALYYALKSLGFKHSMYEAEYYWRVSKDGYTISYTEGDIYIKKQ